MPSGWETAVSHKKKKQSKAFRYSKNSMTLMLLVLTPAAVGAH